MARNIVILLFFVVVSWSGAVASPKEGDRVLEIGIKLGHSPESVSMFYEFFRYVEIRTDESFRANGASDWMLRLVDAHGKTIEERGVKFKRKVVLLRVKKGRANGGKKDRPYDYASIIFSAPGPPSKALLFYKGKLRSELLVK